MTSTPAKDWGTDFRTPPLVEMQSITSRFEHRVSAALRHSSGFGAHYSLGKVKIPLGDNEVAINNLRQTITGDSNPEITRQTYYRS